MAPLVTLEQVTKQHAEKLVLDEITLGIDERDRVGVIGINGSGKSTLLRIVAGVDEPDSGRVVYASGARVRRLAQEPPLVPAATALQAVVDGVPDDLAHEADAVLHRLGIPDPHQPVSTMSGGVRKRVALARVLVEPADLLILDEPTNHLDVDVIDWLEAELRRRARALLLVTHDRYLLERTATRIVELHRGKLFVQHGSYADYLEGRALREQQADAVERKRQNRLRTELAWLRRGPQARTRKARHRVQQARALLGAEHDDPRGDVQIDLPAGRRLGDKVVDLVGAGKRYDDHWVLRGVELRVGAGDRIGLVGPNGSGKTTLLRLVSGRSTPDEGTVSIGETVEFGWYGQQPEPLPHELRVLDAVRQVVLQARTASGGTASAGQLLEQFLFTPAAQKALVGELSGGERRRLELLRMLARGPNVLLLDEPTNDLDLDTLGVLEDYLDAWPGAVIVATHDRFFLDRVCEDVYSLEPLSGGGGLRHHPGGWAAYRSWAAAQEQRRAQPPRRPPRDPGHQSQTAQRRKLGFNERKELARLERHMPALEARKAELAAAVQAAGADYEAAQQASEQLAAIMQELDSAELRWLELMTVEEGQ